MSNGQLYIFDGFVGSQNLLLAQIKANQVCPVPMQAWMTRHGHDLPTKPHVRAKPATALSRPTVIGKRVLEHVARKERVAVADIIGPERRFVEARLRVCRILRRLGYSLTQIGRELGRDHSTVIYYLDRGRVA